MIRSKMKSTWMLGLLLLLGSCQQKGPASGRAEMKGESDSLSVRHGQENALSVPDEYPEGYVLFRAFGIRRTILPEIRSVLT